MRTHLVIAVLGDDQPGVVEQLADTIQQGHGNWQQSQLARWQGKFTGSVEVSVEEAHCSALHLALMALNSDKLSLLVQKSQESSATEAPTLMRLTLVGSDRTGIIRDVANTLAERGINVQNLSSQCSSMPWSGDPMFTAQGDVELPANANCMELEDALDAIADELGLDISLSSVKTVDEKASS